MQTLEETVHALQTCEDVKDEDELERERQEQRDGMIKEGWLFEAPALLPKPEPTARVDADSSTSLPPLPPTEEVSIEADKPTKSKKDGRYSKEKASAAVKEVKLKLTKEEEEDKNRLNEWEKHCQTVRDCGFIGSKGRRFFPGHGKSDGVIVAYLPADRNEGVAMWHMVHDDGDEEDLYEDDANSAARHWLVAHVWLMGWTFAVTASHARLYVSVVG